MATKVRVILTCDLCQTDEGVDTHALTVDGKSMEFELCKRHWTDLDQRMQTYFTAGRKIGRKRRSKTA